LSSDKNLRDAALRLPPELFAVVDGGKFDDIAAALASAGLSGKALYLEGADPDTRAAAGFLVALLTAKALEAVIALARPREVLVLWSWPKGFAALYRHLRTLDVVEIPNETRAAALANGKSSLGEDLDMQALAAAAEMPAHEPVLFRHWDPGVLAHILPLLEAGQQARVFGVVQGVAFDAPHHTGLPLAHRPSGLPPASAGLLRFSEAQIAAITEGQQDAVYREIAQDLLDCWPDSMERPCLSSLASRVRQEQRMADMLGLDGSNALSYLCMLRLVTPESVAETAALARFLNDPAHGPNRDARLERFTEMTFGHLSISGHT
jgi:hypothetical protein